MNIKIIITTIILLFCSLTFDSISQTTTKDIAKKEYDLVVYGGTSGGAIAAVAAAREGLSVLLIEPGNNIGGMTSGGLGYVDVGKAFTIGGLANNFFERMGKHYGLKSLTYRVTPSAAEKTFYQMLNEQNVTILLNSPLKEKSKAKIKKKRIRQIKLESGTKIKGKYFIDATYEGDLMASAKVSYIVGREARDKYNEPGAGICTPLIFEKLNPYNKDGSLLPDLYHEATGEIGSADDRTQAYNFRLCLTQNKKNFVPISKPDDYNPKRYEVLLQIILQSEKEMTLGDIVSIAPLPEEKSDFNNSGMFSTDYINYSWNYPEASYKQRQEIWQIHKNYVQGLFYFLGNDARIPKKLKDETNSWGLSKDEFIGTNHWPHQMYVREARRMVGDFVMTQFDAWDNAKKEETVGMGSYMIDSHYIRKYVENGIIKAEGITGHQPVRPYEIPYRVLTPKRNEVENLLVPVCMSASHVMFGSLRMEPVFMILGESAGTAVSTAIKEGNKAVQDINVSELQKTLRKNGQILSADGGVYLRKDFEGIILDELDADFSGSWFTSSNSVPFMETGGYRYTHDQTILSKAIFSTSINESGSYELYYLFSPGSNRATNAKIELGFSGGNKEFTINMKSPLPKATYPFIKLGDFEFKANENIKLTISNKDADGMVVADAFLIKKKN